MNENKNNSLRSSQIKRYAVSVVILLYVGLMIWLYVMAPVFLVIMGILAAFFVLISALDQQKPWGRNHLIRNGARRTDSF